MKHPNYPDIDFKPSLAIFNYQQTYDLLYLSPCGFRGFANWNYEQYNHFDIVSRLLNSTVPSLISRFKLRYFPVATNYSEILYTSLKQFSGLGKLNYSISNPLPSNLILDYLIDWLPQRQYDTGLLRDYFEILIPFPSGFTSNPDNKIGISYLIDCNSNDTPNYITCSTSQKPYSYDWINHIVTPEMIDSNGNYRLVVRGKFCVCSMIVYELLNADNQIIYPKQPLESTFNQISQGFLFTNLQTFLNILVDWMDNNLYKEYRDYDLDGVRWEIQVGKPQTNIYDPDSIVFNLAEHNYQASSYTYKSLPEYLKKSVFVGANNNYWGNGVLPVIADEGDFHFTESDFNFTENNLPLIDYHLFDRVLYYGGTSFPTVNQAVNEMGLSYRPYYDYHTSLYQYINQEGILRQNIYNEFPYYNLITNSTSRVPIFKDINNQAILNDDFEYQNNQNNPILKYDNHVTITDELPDNTFLDFAGIPVFTQISFSRLYVRNGTKTQTIQTTDIYNQDHLWAQYGVKFTKKDDGKLKDIKFYCVYGYLIPNPDKQWYFAFDLLKVGEKYDNSDYPTTVNWVKDGVWQTHELTFKLPFTLNKFYNSLEDIPDAICRDVTFLSEYELAYKLQEIQENDMSNILLEEIHQALNADKYAWYQNSDGNSQPATNSLGWKIDKVSQALGINFNLGGQILSIRQSKEIPRGVNLPIGYYFGQFGINIRDGQPHDPNDRSGMNGGVAGEERLGIVYQVKCNQVVYDEDNEPVALKAGSYVLCESIVQYLELLQRDLDKALDWQNLGGGIIDFNGKTQVTEGLFDILQEMTVVSADTNKTTEETKISSLIIQQLAKEILKAIGLPSQVKKFDFILQSNDPNFIASMGGKEVKYEVPYNGVAEGSPTVASLLLILLENIALGNIGKLQLNDNEALKQDPPKEPDNEIIPKEKDNDFLKNLQLLPDSRVDDVLQPNIF